MKLKQITQLLIAAFSVLSLGSCLSDSTTYVSEDASANAQIYSLSLSATLANVNSIDSANFPVLATTKFSIDQFRSLIYNADSLPYKTRLTKYMATLTYESPYKIEVLYPNDSVVTWTSTDSIDFSLYPRLRVTAANGTSTREYTIDIRIHKIDPDSIIWSDATSAFRLPSTIKLQKTLLVGTVFHTFSIDSDSKFYHYTIDKTATSPSAWVRQATTVIPATVKLESITYFNGTFYAVDADGKAYGSTDGATWQVKSSNVSSILGVLPGKEVAKDSLLVVTKLLGQYVFAKTSDMQTLHTVDKISYNNGSTVPSGFPYDGFTAVTNYDRSNLNKNILVVTAAQTTSNQTWTVRQGDGLLEVESNQTHTVFSASENIRTFLYDGYLYAVSRGMLYKTGSFGYKWAVVASKEEMPFEMGDTSKQSIVVDSDNYIWIFGGVSTSGSATRNVWKGRINRLAH